MKTIKKISMLIIVGIITLSFYQPAFSDDGKININSASKEQLMTLKYIGEKIADRIIEYRQSHPFSKLEDIMLVKGIGEKVYEANKHLIEIKDS